MLLIFILLATSSVVVSAYETVYAVNYGKNAKDHTDVTNITYKASNANCEKKYVTSMDYTNVPAADQELYQKYCSYIESSRITRIQLPISRTGHYILNQKFTPSGNHLRHDVILNEVHTIMHSFDTLESSKALNKAYDEVTSFSICDDCLWYKGESSAIVDNSITLQYRSKGGFIDVSALGLFKRDNGEEFPLPSTVTNFDKYDLDHQLQYECKGNELSKVDLVSTTPETPPLSATPAVTGSLFYFGNSTVHFNFYFNNIFNYPNQSLLPF